MEMKPQRSLPLPPRPHTPVAFSTPAPDVSSPPISPTLSLPWAWPQPLHPIPPPGHHHTAHYSCSSLWKPGSSLGGKKYQLASSRP